MAILSRFGPDETRTDLDAVGFSRRSVNDIVAAIERTDLGKFLTGTHQATFEARGTPATAATAAFQLIADGGGLSAGRDKRFNEGLRDGLAAFAAAKTIPITGTLREQVLDFCPLIPDNALIFEDEILCIEYAWRSGEFLTTGHRAEVAGYMLTKLRNYARELGWLGS